MSRQRATYKYIVPFLALFFATATTLEAQVRQDTIDQIQKYRENASEAIFSQDFETAVSSIESANELASLIDEGGIKADVLITSAELHFFLYNYEKAAKESVKAITFFENNGDKGEIANAYLLYGSILTRLGDFDSADRYLKSADEMFTQLNDDERQSKVLLGMGLLELERGNPKNAVNYFDAAIPLYKSFGLTYQEAFSQINKAEALLELDVNKDENILVQAKYSLQETMKIFDLKSYPRLEIESYKIAAKIALKENDVATAENYFNLYANKKDSLNQLYIRAISKSTDIELSVGDLNEIIATQQTDLDKKKKSINFGKMTNGLSIALIVILSLLTLSLYKNNNLRAKANELLQDKNSELLLAKEKAEKASLAKAQFLSTITHELRTPLYAVTGLTHLLMEENPKEHQKEHLNSLKFSGEYLLSLINNILDLNKLEANKVEVEQTTFNLKKRINDVLVALKKSADDRKNNLVLEFDESIPERLAGDPLKLSQILINLIGNSVKFTQNGEVCVRIKKIDQKKNKVTLHFEVEDNGVGISKKKQKSIFETFSQGSLQINRKFGGTGLGLSIVKNLLELMNSKIQLESQLGQGSKFWFNIIFNVSEEEVADNKNPNNIIYDVDYVALENRFVLVVEDNKINQMITKKILEKNKMKCLVADNGMEAIKMVQENNFDVVLMDIHMPGISGIEATQKIREFNTQLPIIALTAVTIDENLDDFYRAGFNEIIPKPFKPEEFFEKIYRTLDGKKQIVTSS